MNIRLFSYEELINILKNDKHSDYNYISSIFGDLDEDYMYDDGIFDSDNYIISFGENCIEVGQDDYFLIDCQNSWCTVLKSLDNLKNDILDLIKFDKEED